MPTPDGQVVEVDGPIKPDQMPPGLIGARRVHIKTQARDACPAWVRDLADLTDLQITYQGHYELPTLRVRASTRLRKLIIRGAGIREIDIEPSTLWNLRTLDIGRTVVANLPSELRQASRLEEMILDYPMSILPDWIGELTALRRLIVSGTLITNLPNSIKSLSALEEIDISRTKLTELPASVGALQGLRRITANDSPIDQLAPEIGALRNLIYLSLEGCPLRRLPAEWGQMQDSIELRLRDNQLNEPLPALVDRGVPAVLSYLRSLAEGSQAQYEAKVLLLGEGNVGKSSLVAALQGKQFLPGRPTTHGIELSTLTLPHPRLGTRLKLTTWDFGGQEVYRVTHQFFYSPRSLYLLVWRPREGHEENSIEGWVRRVALRIGDTGKIILVATYGSEGRNPELDFPYLQSKFGGMLLESLIVDNKTGLGIEALRDAIARHSATLPQMGELLSTAWISARDEILSHSRERAYIIWPELVAICENHGLDHVETITLSSLLHDLGHLIHFGEDEGLRDLVVLRPEWLTKAISYVLEDRETRKSGVLQYDRLSLIWHQNLADHATADHSSYDRANHPYFLRLMEKFDVSYRLPDQQASLVGQLVPFRRPDLPWQFNSALPRGIRTLKLLCSMPESPPGMIAWLTVRNHRFWAGKHWRRGAFLEHREYAAQGLFELSSDGELRLEVRAPSPDIFFSLLCDSVEYLIELRWPGLRHEFLVPCPQLLSRVPCTGTFNRASLRRFRELGKIYIDCHTCAQPQEVARLLTGFELASTRLDDQLGHIIRHLEDARTDQQQIAAIASETAAHIRNAIKILSAEITDCPRLFIVEHLTKRRRLPWNDHYRLVLCCEHPEDEHPWEPASYNFARPKAWFRDVLPYAIFASRVLKVAMPVASSTVNALAPQPDAQWFERQFKIVQSVAERVPEKGPEQATAQPGDQRLTPAQGQGLRTYRYLLFELDPGRSFGGLNRVVNPAGDVLWVCPKHYRDYEPGLPRLTS